MFSPTHLVACCFYSFVSVFTANNYQQYANFTSGWNFSMRFFLVHFSLVHHCSYYIVYVWILNIFRIHIAACFFLCVHVWMNEYWKLKRWWSFKYLLVTAMWFDSHCFIAWLGIHVLFHPLLQYVWLFQIFFSRKTIWNQLTSVISGARMCVCVCIRMMVLNRKLPFFPLSFKRKRKFWQIFNRWLSISCGLTTRQ